MPPAGCRAASGRPSSHDGLVIGRLRALWLSLIGGLWFIPALMVVGFGALAFILVELDEELQLASDSFVFKGDAPAARTVLSVLAGSLITVAGLTLSITVVVLQLASSQFSPRILRTFFGDRLTQLTVGTYVGIFVYSVILLRAVGSAAEGGGFVPRLSITVASAFGIAAVVLLIVFIHHISQLIQVSHVTADIADKTLRRLEVLYPEPYGEPARDEDMLDSWRAEAPGRVFPRRPGYVLHVDLDAIVGALENEPPARLALLARPGNFAPLDRPLAEVWPAAAAERVEAPLRAAVSITAERDLDQDIGFGLRQLADTAVKALSPGINDPTTATTCVGYIRSILVQLAGRSFPAPMRRVPGDAFELYASHPEFGDFVDYLLEIGRYAAGDPRVAGAVLEALHGIASTALGAGSPDRAQTAVEAARIVGRQAADEAKNEHDRQAVQQLQLDVERLLGPGVAGTPDGR